MARALVSSGMRKAGYEYVNIDEGWWLGDRDKNGNIVVDAKQWAAIKSGERAGDMTNIVRYIHSLGLKAGIYTDAGEAGCSFYGPDLGPPKPHTGSEGHYEQDFLQFAKWGFDYVKVDWCGGNKENLDPAVQYTEIARAIHRAEAMTGHTLFYSICNWGKQSPWTWAPGVDRISADIWRTSGDIVAPIVAGTPNSKRMASFSGMLSNFDHGIHPEAQHTGFYNDPDRMVVGMQGLSDAQNRVHMSLWAISGAPLLVGADVTKLSKATADTLLNSEVIAVDQDALGLQCFKAAEPSTGVQVWVKPLAEPGQRAVVLLNRTNAAAQVSVPWGELGLQPTAAMVRDLWAHKNLGSHNSVFTASVPAGDAVMLKVSGQDGKQTHYKPSSSSATGERNVTTLANVKASAKMVCIRISYANPDKSPRFSELRVNGQMPAKIAFPPTGSAPGTITIESELQASGASNHLTFASACNHGPALESISVLSY